MDNPTTTPPRRPAKPATAPMTPIKGSWEDKLTHGQQMLAVQNDEGVEALAQLIDRLAKVPEAQRMAAHQRLNQILFAALTDLIPYLTYRDRYDQAIAYAHVAERFASLDSRHHWQLHRASILVQAGEVGEGLSLMQEISRSSEPELWRYLVLEATRLGQIDIAVAVCNELEQTVNRVRKSAVESEEIRQLAGILGYVRALTALAQGNVEEATAWMEFGLTNDDEARQYDLARFYIGLVEKELYAEALPWVRRERGHPVREKFWTGFIEHHLGRHTEAKQRWRQVIDLPLPDSAEIDGTELILAHYYLGDKEGLGLSIILESLRSDRQISSNQFFLAGLGWAIRGDPTAAHSNFRLAVMRTKSMAMGQTLPSIWWRFCKDLIPEESQSDYMHYFSHQRMAS